MRIEWAIVGVELGRTEGHPNALTARQLTARYIYPVPGINFCNLLPRPILCDPQLFMCRERLRESLLRVKIQVAPFKIKKKSYTKLLDIIFLVHSSGSLAKLIPNFLKTIAKNTQMQMRCWQPSSCGMV